MIRPMTTNTAVWLTSRRLRAHALLLGVTLWSLYLWTLATPGLRDRNGNLKGTDFLHFYTLGSLALAHDGAHLYDINAQAEVAARRVPAAGGIRYLPLYPPQVSLIFAPLARLSYPWALALWWIASVAIYGACCYAIWRACPNLHGRGAMTALIAAAFPAFFHLVAWGQTSALALACFTLVFCLLRGQREFAAGLALGCLIFKPQLGLVAAIVFLSLGAWKIVAGAGIAAAAELSLGAFYYGAQPLRQWLQVIRRAGSVMALLEPKPYQTHCLRTFWSMLLPWANVALALYVMSAAVVIAIVISLWQQRRELPLRFSALLLATVLVSPHLTVYDLVILAPAILLLTDWLIGRSDLRQTRRIGMAIYLVYALPFLGVLTRWTHVQLSVVAMAVLLWLIAKESDHLSSAAAAVAHR